jgi:hypothetical protein
LTQFKDNKRSIPFELPAKFLARSLSEFATPPSFRSQLWTGYGGSKFMIKLMIYPG